MRLRIRSVGGRVSIEVPRPKGGFTAYQVTVAEADLLASLISEIAMDAQEGREAVRALPRVPPRMLARV